MTDPDPKAADPSPEVPRSESDWVPDSTGEAPTYIPPLNAPTPPVPPSPGPDWPQPRQLLGDFRIMLELGQGSFGRVYLAEEVSMGRLVALKVSCKPSEEGPALGTLEHPHIVRVFFEEPDPTRGFRLLCLQFVPGATLGRVIGVLKGRPPPQRDGATVLEVLDGEYTRLLDSFPSGSREREQLGRAIGMDPTAARERELVARFDWIEAGCWIGARLAEALAHAHGLRVYHFDVKPANVLLNPYGRPLLADFNVASCGRREETRRSRLGGTLAYMAPEHLVAFAGVEGGRSQPEVDARADLYSLGVVLFEWFVGRLPPEDWPANADNRVVARLLAQRRLAAGPPPIPDESPLPPAVKSTLRRCLEPDTNRRFPSARVLARSLEGCVDLERVCRELPPPGRITRALLVWPFALGCFLVLLPHFLGSIVNISYNSLQIVRRLTLQQQDIFRTLVTVYNLVVYPLCIAGMLCLVLPLRRDYLSLYQPTPPSPEEMDSARRRALRVPGWSIVLSLLGWLPGALLFPVYLNWRAGPLGGEVYRHFLISFLLSGLIALTFSYFATQYLITRILYPQMWLDAADLTSKARRELQAIPARLRWFQSLAVLIPLGGAVLMLGLGPEAIDMSGEQSYRLLVTALVVVGMLGLGVAVIVSSRLADTVRAFSGEGR